MNHNTICIGVQETHVFTVPRFQCIIIEIIHEMLGQIKYGHADVYGFVEQNFFFMVLNAYQIWIEDDLPCKGWFGYVFKDLLLLVRSEQPNIDALANVFHSLPEHLNRKRDLSSKSRAGQFTKFAEI